MTGKCSLEPWRAVILQWEKPVSIIGNQDILQGKTTYTINSQENRNLLDAGFQNFA